ncbi:MAG TPA: Ig-like domain-containing protein [Gemmatimonadaceae bacterium]|jgi:uncharacterized protein YjdB|nr:Ig-like domain-containing protein [Gemmatimonadaceae bacterium]
MRLGAVVVSALAMALLACGSALDVNDAPVASVKIAPASLTLGLGLVAPLQATAEDATGDVLHDRRIFWTSSDTTVATVSGAGVVTALAIGTAIIAASAEGASGTATITVTPPPVAKVAVLPESAQTTVGATVQLQAVTYDALGNVLTGRTISWSSSNQQVATVDGNGRVKALAAGAVPISATSEGQTGSATITIVVPVDHVEVRPTFVIVAPGKTTQLTALVYDAQGNQLSDREITWGTSDQSVATVSQTGLVTGVKNGGAQISATVEGKNATASILVSSLLGSVRAVQP